MVDQLNAFASEVTRVAREVGTEGKLGGQAQVRGVAGTWKDLTDSVNFMASNLTAQVRNIAEVTTAVATGDLSKKITVGVKGEILKLKDTINTMVDQLNAFASEVTRVAREVGTEGKLGGQAQVRGVAGTWKDLTDSVNFMARNLTNQVRGIAKVVTAVANGDLKRKLALEARGEIAELAETINNMIDTLATFGDQVTTVAREVGVDGKLGGQAKVPGAAGSWRDLTDNVNQLAGNLTTQVRAISDVATAVTKGDLTRSITVEAKGEVAALKDNINEMIRNLRATTQKTTEQDWLKTNLAKFTRMLQGQRDLVTVAQQILSELAPLVSAQHGVFYIAETDAEGDVVLKLLASYAYTQRKSVANRFKLGEGLVGQCAFEKQKILITKVPPDYVRVTSGLGEAPPLNIIVLPVLFEGQVNALIELASFSTLSDIHQVFLDQLTESIGIVVNTIAASMRTEGLLSQSQSLTQELQSQQEELRETNERLERQAATLRESEERLKAQQEELRGTNEELEEKAKLLELKNREVELAKREVEDKAEQLALTSKYKSEFLANMSHELRTPLNSLLILSKMLSGNPEGNLTQKQVEFAATIHASGADLLCLINDILDLSKIESGTMAVVGSDVELSELCDYVEQSFRPVADQRRLSFEILIADGTPRSLHTDVKRLQQVLRNLLSNAFKFTERGGVKLECKVATSGWRSDLATLHEADRVIAFSVTDSGIGIPEDKQKIVFEAFQQADGTTSRKYGGTGLGLSISREIARLLGGEIRVQSAPGLGSTFTLYLPRVFREPLEPASGAARALERMRTPLRGSPTDRPATPAELPPPDDRERIVPGDRTLLVVEHDVRFARVLLEAAHEHGFKVVIAPRGEVALTAAVTMRPAAITLDLRLPDVDGWTVLDVLKHEPATRHVPVAIISVDEQRLRGLRMGAVEFLQKPVSEAEVGAALGHLAELGARREKTLLLLEEDVGERARILELIGNTDVTVSAVERVDQAVATLAERPVDCVVVDVGSSEASVLELLRHLRRSAAPVPVIAYGRCEPHRKLARRLEIMERSMVLKRVSDVERLFDETSVFLHRSETALSERQRRVLEELRRRGPSLEGAKVLVVDDDVRNIFAVSSFLEGLRAEVIYAESGAEGLALLEKNPDVRAVLMDIMMPEMDGYEVMRRIRGEPRWRALPIIALTAKAMSGDREKCIQAGASDYIAKPVDMGKLVSILRVWLTQ
jgi:signal transduction histidine kinase/DNA-binding response OmpR family regulator/HAMP domain-containing protein